MTNEQEPGGEGRDMAQTLCKTVDTRYAFRGTYDKEPHGVCRVRVLGSETGTPVLLITELNENHSTSVTNMIEVLAAELLAKHLPHRFDALDDDPAWVIEHYEASQDPTGRVRRTPSYDRVTFTSWRPKQIWLGGQMRLSLGDPRWYRLPAELVLSLIDNEAEDLLGEGR